MKVIEWSQYLPYNNPMGAIGCHFDWIFFIIACNKDNRNSLNEFELKVETTSDYVVNCPWAS